MDEPLPDARRPRPPRPDRQVVGRLRRDGRADDAPGRVRRARLARRRRAVRGQRPAQLRRGRPQPARQLRGLLRGLLRAPREGRPDGLGDARRAAGDVRLRGRLLARPRQPGQGAAAVRHRDRPPDRRRLGAVAGQGPGADGARARGRAAVDAPDLPRRRATATSTSSISARRRSRRSSTRSASPYTLDLFDAKHGGLTFRYPGAIRELVLAFSQ